MAKAKIRDRDGARIHGTANETRHKYGLFFNRLLFTLLLPSMRCEGRDRTEIGCVFKNKLRVTIFAVCVK